MASFIDLMSSDTWGSEKKSEVERFSNGKCKSLPNTKIQHSNFAMCQDSTGHTHCFCRMYYGRLLDCHPMCTVIIIGLLLTVQSRRDILHDILRVLIIKCVVVGILVYSTIVISRICHFDCVVVYMYQGEGGYYCTVIFMPAIYCNMLQYTAGLIYLGLQHPLDIGKAILNIPIQIVLLAGNAFLNIAKANSNTELPIFLISAQFDQKPSLEHRADLYWSLQMTVFKQE